MHTTVTDDNFATEVAESSLPVLLDFWAEWCMPCRMLDPVLTDLGSAYSGRLKIGKVNVDESPELAMSHNVVSIPTLLLFKNGVVVEKHIGAAPLSTFESLIRPHL